MIPIDYSENSKAALKYGAELALGFGASLDIVHVWDRPTYLTDAIMVQRPGEAHKPIGELIRENAQHDMNEFLAELDLPSTFGGVAVSSRLIAGEPASALIAELKKGEHDLVILSTHGRTGFAHLTCCWAASPKSWCGCRRFRSSPCRAPDAADTAEAALRRHPPAEGGKLVRGTVPTPTPGGSRGPVCAERSRASARHAS